MTITERRVPTAQPGKIQQESEMAKGEFSVYWWDQDGGQHEEHRFVDAETAVHSSKRLTHGPAALIGFVQRVMITDGGDCCSFEWNINDGIIFPPPPDEKGEGPVGMLPDGTLNVVGFEPVDE